MSDSVEEYHRHTSYARYSIGGGGLDFGNQPNVFKSYPGLVKVPLPPVLTQPSENLSSVIRQSSDPKVVSQVNVDRLAQITVLTHSLTAKARYGGDVFYYRSVASAGALYPFELYVGTLDVQGIADGLYHHSVGDHALTLLRSGNIVPVLADAVPCKLSGSPVVAFFLTSIFFRSSWKYRDRAYRYNLLDTGHLAENLCLALGSMRLPYEFSYDFDDEKVNNLLSVDPTHEVCLAVVCIGGKEPLVSGNTDKLKEPPADFSQASWVSIREQDYPLIKQIHATTSARMTVPDKAPKMLHNLGLEMEPAEKIPRADSWPETFGYSEAVFKRRSNRNFVPTELSADKFVALLELLCSAHRERVDVPGIAAGSVAVGFLAANVEDLDPGFYMLDQEEAAISLVTRGEMMDVMAHTCLDQEWLRNCALHFLFLSNLELLEQVWGPRGYRYAMMTAGHLGQRIYVGATAMRIGCCGIGAFYDDEVARLLGLGDRSSLLYLVAAGPLKKWTEPRG